jgi:hypothetical protein
MGRRLVEQRIADAFLRLNAVLDTETRELDSGRPINLAASADAKARILLELAMASGPQHTSGETRGEARADAQSEPAGETSGLSQQPNLLEATRASLARNAAALERHMRATRHVAQALARALRARDSDGTYGPAAMHGRYEA